MKKKAFDLLLKTISKVTGKKVLYINKNYVNYKNLAVKSKYGFWYCGNVFDQTDIAYGVASVGDIESEDTDLVFKILKKLKSDYVFYDIGANTGWYSMLAATVSQNSKVISFEPISEHIEPLTQSIYLNRFDSRLAVQPVALSNTEGEADILLAGTGSSLEKNFLEKNEGVRKVKLEMLDNLVKNNNIPLPDFIKIDVEGHEYNVLLGAKETISKSLPILFVEIACTLKNLGRDFINPNYKDIFFFIVSMGYKPYTLKTKQLVKYSTDEIQDGVQMYLFLHNTEHKEVLDLV